jgi:hypothetical protein
MQCDATAVRLRCLLCFRRDTDHLNCYAALSVIFFMIEQLKKIGMRTEYLEHIEILHFWSTYAALAWIALVFFAKLSVVSRK